MRLVDRLSIFAVFALVAAELSPARAHSANPLDWIIQHVCADASDKAVPVDPYGGCFQGTHERRLNINEPIPYYRHDEAGQKSGHPLGLQRHDAYPIVDRHYGGVVSANDFDFDYSEPYGVMHPGDGDGYDVYRVANGWVTGGDTRDGSGYSQSFFGADCRPFGGWLFFPIDFLHELRPGAQGRTIAPICGVYWEQAGQAWPGRCEQGEGFSTSTLTTWSFSPEHEFGGLGGRKSKRIDAIVATHGLTLQPISPLRRLHIERIYFTDLYGATRWEVLGSATPGSLQKRTQIAVARRRWSTRGIPSPLSVVGTGPMRRSTIRRVRVHPGPTPKKTFWRIGTSRMAKCRHGAC